MIVSVEKREHETMLAKNKSNLEFYVAIPSGSYKAPTFCTCCMKATDNKEKIIGTLVKKGLLTKKTQAVVMYFPICQECLSHRKEVLRKRNIWVGTTVVVSLLIFYFITTLEFPYKYAFLMYLAVVSLLLLAMGMMIKVVFLAPQHSTHEYSVQVAAIDPKENMVFFRFSNWRYAKMFAVANNSELKEHPYRNRMHSNQMLKVIARPKRFSLTIIAVSLLISIFLSGFLLISS